MSGEDNGYSFIMINNTISIPGIDLETYQYGFPRVPVVLLDRDLGIKYCTFQFQFLKQNLICFFFFFFFRKIHVAKKMKFICARAQFKVWSS